MNIHNVICGLMVVGALVLIGVKVHPCHCGRGRIYVEYLNVVPGETRTVIVGSGGASVKPASSGGTGWKYP